MAFDIRRLEAGIAEQNQTMPFSGVIFIRENGQTLHAKGYGFANKAEQIPVELNTRFGIASGAKIFAAIAICQLVEQGLLTFETLVVATYSIRTDKVATTGVATRGRG